MIPLDPRAKKKPPVGGLVGALAGLHPHAAQSGYAVPVNSANGEHSGQGMQIGAPAYTGQTQTSSAVDAATAAGHPLTPAEVEALVQQDPRFDPGKNQISHNLAAALSNIDSTFTGRRYNSTNQAAAHGALQSGTLAQIFANQGRDQANAVTGANIGAQDALADLRGQIGNDLLRNPPGVGAGTTAAINASVTPVPPGGVGRVTDLGGFYRPGPPAQRGISTAVTSTKPKKPKSLARVLTPSTEKRAR